MSHQIQTISMAVKPMSGVFFSSPSHTAPQEDGLYDAQIEYTTADGWVGHFAVVRYPQAGVTMGRFVWSGGAVAEPYTQLKTAGNTSLKIIDGHWVVPVKAMRIKNKPWPTLNRVDEEELDWLIDGSFRGLLGQFGNFDLERLGDIDSTAGRQIINGLGLKMEAENHALLGAMIAVTRPLALVKPLP